MDRERALLELKARIINEEIIRHSLAVEAIMRGLASYLKEDVERWGLAGLLHDIDRERVAENFEMHGIKGAEILENLDVDPEVVYAVKSHCDHPGIARNRKVDKALYLADSFANGADAEELVKCNEIGLTVEKFTEIALEAMRGIPDEPDL